jgi:hypothetical protein
VNANGGQPLQRGAVLVVLLLLAALPACGRVVHPAAVSPGWFLDVLPGIARIEHTPRTGRMNPALESFQPFQDQAPVGQFNIGYGWRFSRHCGLQLASSFGFDSAPTVAPYFQLLGHPLDVGVGGTVSLNGRTLPRGFVPGAYTLIGKQLPFAGFEQFRVDGGVRWLRIHDGVAWQEGYGPNVLLTIQRNTAALGVWADYLQLTGPVLRSLCSDTCGPADLQRSNLSAGVFLRFGARPARAD